MMFYKTMIRRFRVTLVFVSVLTVSTTSTVSAAQLKFPPSLIKPTQCMLRVLRNTPGVDRAATGVNDLDGRPYIEFRYKTMHGYRPTISFEAIKSSSPKSDSSEYYFQAAFGGLFGPPDKGPPVYGADEIEQRWKIKCGVNAYILFV